MGARKIKPATTRGMKLAAAPGGAGLLPELRELIRNTRQSVAWGVNAALARLYWKIGTRIRTDILANQRAEYGAQVLQTLSRELTVEFGRGFTKRNLENMVRFAEVFPDEQIVHALSAQLGWTHFRLIIYLKDPLKRDFYAEMCRLEKWSTRTLQQKIDSMLYERTALSKKPDDLIRQELDALREEDTLTPTSSSRIPISSISWGSRTRIPARGFIRLTTWVKGKRRSAAASAAEKASGIGSQDITLPPELTGNSASVALGCLWFFISVVLLLVSWPLGVLGFIAQIAWAVRAANSPTGKAKNHFLQGQKALLFSVRAGLNWRWKYWRSSRRSTLKTPTMKRSKRSCGNWILHSPDEYLPFIIGLELAQLKGCS